MINFSESGTVTSRVDGPGSNASGDPNPIASTEIQIDVDHSHISKATNNWFDPLAVTDFDPFAAGADQLTEADTNDSRLTYIVSGGGTVTYTFHATFTSPWDFDSDVSLTLVTTDFEVTIDMGGGFLATDSNGNPLASNPDFGLDTNDTADATLTVPNVPDGYAIDIDYSSQLETPIDENTTVDPGTTTDHTDFHWNLTIDIQ